MSKWKANYGENGIEVELNEMAKYHEQVSVIEEYFIKEKEWPKDW